MTWNCYLVIFKAESPIHIGYRQIGILKTTRYYITGKAMWGAVTANLTRALFDNTNSNDYQAVGNFVKENIKTTYFFPAIKGEIRNIEELTDIFIEIDNEKFGIFLPEYTEKGLKFGKLSKEKFEQIFIGSFVSTALDATTKTAEEGSLHEFEFIKNRVKIGEEKSLDVYWVGYIFVKEEAKNEKVEINKCEEKDVKIKRVDINEPKSLHNILNLIHVGGERNYGLGRLKMHKFVKETDNKIFRKFDFEFPDNNVILKNLAIAISHVKLNGIELELGEIEPLVGLEWDNEKNRGAGQKVSDAEICATPGSKLKSGNFVLCDYGILGSE